MRDFRDAKVMAHALRDALKAKTIETSHSECLELIAKTFGYDNWNILSARIEAAESHDADRRSPTKRDDSASRNTLYCSFCGKSQHEVRKLIAGPTVFICDECVSLCDDIIDDEGGDQEILNLLKADAESGNQAYSAAQEYLRRMSTEGIAAFVARCSRAVEHNRLALQFAQSLVDMRDGKTAIEGALASPRFAHLLDKPREELLADLEKREHLQKRYEQALRIGLAVLEGRRQQN